MKVILIWVEYNLNITAYSQSREYSSADLCGGHVFSLGLPFAFSVEKKLGDWQNCCVCYR